MHERIEETYTIEYIESLPDGERAELIDGKIYNMATPNRIHQQISMQLSISIGQFIRSNSGPCQVYAAPFAVYLDNDDYTYVEPDISVICDDSKLDNKGCHGAPDWVIEIVSPSSTQMDYIIKLNKYSAAGVREYWIVDPIKETVLVYVLGEELDTKQYSFNDDIPVHIYDNFNIKIAELL